MPSLSDLPSTNRQRRKGRQANLAALSVTSPCIARCLANRQTNSPGRRLTWRQVHGRLRLAPFGLWLAFWNRRRGLAVRHGELVVRNAGERRHLVFWLQTRVKGLCTVI